MKTFQILKNGAQPVFETNKLTALQNKFKETTRTLIEGEVLETTQRGRTLRIVEKTARGLFEVIGLGAKVGFRD